MFIIQEDKSRSYDKGQIFIELTKNRDLSVVNCDRLGYWCDKAHLRHIILEIIKIMSDIELKELLGERLK